MFVADCGAVTTINDVEQAYRAIGEAEHAYRDTVRKALAEKATTQADLVRRLGRSREMLRQDAMTEDERAAIRAAELDRQRARRGGG